VSLIPPKKAKGESTYFIEGKNTETETREHLHSHKRVTTSQGSSPGERSLETKRESAGGNKADYFGEREFLNKESHQL